MPIDGTYGRFRAHNQRVKDLRRRRNKKTHYNFLKPIRIKRIHSEKFDSNKTEKIKIEIRKKIRSNRRKEYLISFIVSLFVVYVVVFILTR